MRGIQLIIVAVVVVIVTSTTVAGHTNTWTPNKNIARFSNSFSKKLESFLQRKQELGLSNEIGVIAENSPALVTPTLTAESAVKSVSNNATLRLVGLFALWYAFNAGYNVYNAFIKQDFQFPWTISTLQLFVGLIYALPLWALKIRPLPNLTWNDFGKILPIAALNAIGHTTAVIAMFEKGGGSFTHVIKASEPVVSVLMAILINQVFPKPFTFLSLLPITYGVAYASTLGKLNIQTMSTELTSKAAKMAMASNIAFALRSIFRKNLPKDFKQRTRLDPANEHALTTFLSGLLLIPFVLSFESLPQMSEAYQSLANKSGFNLNLIICGMCFYLYNEIQNIVLSSLGAVPTAVGNTLKRVFVFIALYYFTKGESFPLPKVVGCSIAILGCLAFAIFDSKKM